MKKCVSIFLFFSFILFTYYAFSGTTTLTTYYPPPTAAYNKVQLSTTSSTNTQSSASVSCGNSLNPKNTGAIFVDGSGNLNVCISGTPVSYPQECYNSFCSYDPAPSVGLPVICHPTCAANFIKQTAINSPTTTAWPSDYDSFQTSTHVVVNSIVCCSGTNGAITISSSSSGGGSTLPGAGSTLPPQSGPGAPCTQNNQCWAHTCSNGHCLDGTPPNQL